MSKNKEIMDTKEVSEFLKLHPFTVNKLAREGKIPAFKIGADWRFHRKYIESWIKEKVAYNAQRKERRKANGSVSNRQRNSSPPIELFSSEVASDIVSRIEKEK